jgi:ferredoxin
MANDILGRDILYNNAQIGPYPTDKLKRVDKPTTLITGPMERRDEREHSMARAFRGDFGKNVADWMPLMTVTEPLGAALTEVQRHINTIQNNPVAPKKAPIPDNPRVLARHLKSLALFLGADMVGICELPKSAIYTHTIDGTPVDINFKYAVVFLAQKNVETVNCSNGYDWIFDPVSFQTYQRLACQTETMANYIRRLGHEADASNMFTYLTLMPELVMAAGLGEPSRMGIMVNPFLGGNFKSAAVLTNMPLEADTFIDFGLQQYCETCRICVEVCPTKSISAGAKVEHNGYMTWKMNEQRCTSFNALNPNGCVCGRCTKMCPWSRPVKDPAEFADWDGSIEALHAMVDEVAAERRAAGFKNPLEETDKWWFDLECKDLDDSELVIPKTTKMKNE